MVKFAIFLLLTSVSLTCCASRVRRIVNGFDAEEGSVPWMASLYRKRELVDLIDFSIPAGYCGGALVAGGKFLLTAGHCLVNKNPEDILVFLDLYNLDDKFADNFTSLAFEAEEFFMHENYDDHPKRPSSDIALIKLKTNETRDAINFAGHDFVLGEDENFLISGWGRTSRNGLQPRVLQNLEGLKQDDSCNFLGDAGFLDDHICLKDLAGTSRRWRDICRGDSGGPLVAVRQDGEKHLVGLVSFGTCLGIPASVFTRVSFYANWIAAIIAANE